MNQKSKYYNLFRSSAVALLLVGYVSAFLWNGLHHIFLHDYAAHESCSAKNEKDSCHRFIFHNDNTVKCSHDGHIYAPKHECELCDALVAQYHFPEVKTFAITFYENETSSLIFEEKIAFRFSYPSISLRGPPYLS